MASSSAPAIWVSVIRRKPPPLTMLASMATPMPVGVVKLGVSRSMMPRLPLPSVVSRSGCAIPKPSIVTVTGPRDNHEGSRGGDREVGSGDRHARREAVNHDAGQAHGIRPLRAETDAAVEMEAVGIDSEQQLAAQDDAGARQENPQEVSDGGLRNRELEPRDAERRAPGIRRRGHLEHRLLQVETDSAVWSDLERLRCFRAERQLRRAAGNLLDAAEVGHRDRERGIERIERELQHLAEIDGRRDRVGGEDGGDERRGKGLGAEDFHGEPDRIAVGVGGDLQDQSLEHDGVGAECRDRFRSGRLLRPELDARHRDDPWAGQDAGDRERVLSTQELELLPQVLDRIVDRCRERGEDAGARPDEPGRRQAGPHGRAPIAQRTVDRHRDELAEHISVRQRRGVRHVDRGELRRIRHESGHDAPEVFDWRDERQQVRIAAFEDLEELRQIGRQLRDVARARVHERLQLSDRGIVEPDRFQVRQQRIGIRDHAFETVDDAEEKSDDGAVERQR